MDGYYLDSNGVYIKKKKKEQNEKDWIKSGAFSDGYQFGDVTKTILGTSTDLVQEMGEGVLEMGEKVVDTGAYIAGGVGGLLGAKDFQNDMQDFIAKDLYDSEKLIKSTQLFGTPLLGGQAFVPLLLEAMGTDEEEVSLLGDKSEGVANSVGQLAGTAGLQMAGVPWWVTTGVTSFGTEAENAFNQGATYGEAGGSALISAGAEILAEKLSGGIKFGGKTLDDVLLKPMVEQISKKAVRTMAQIGVNAAGEGVEEAVSQVFSNLGTALYREEDLGEIMGSEEALEGYIDSFFSGAILGGGMSGINAVSSKAIGKDYVTGLTNNEQKVVDVIANERISEQEADGKKLSTKEKSKIRSEVESEMDKGYIDVDKIESILGGEDYKSYDSLSKEMEEYTNLNKIKAMELTGEQSDRLAELKEKNRAASYESEKTRLKNQLSKNVQELVKNDRLAESYNEKGRRSQVYQADLSQYDTVQQSTIQKAIDSGILNNTNRTHEFVDMIAKISADKGVSFDFTNNQKLKESGFALQGKTVNGYIQDGNISLNINSAKALNKVVGHEITHVLEGTELYTELQNTIIEYAKSKGDYDARIKSLEELYKDVEGADINAELTADLVGDYLFSDSNFVSRLSVEQPNIFKKIYDEIKYLLKVATAGSKEAKQLLKVQRVFEKAYKEMSHKKVESKEAIYSLYVDENIRQKAEQFKREGYKGNERVKVLDVTPRINAEVERLIGFDATGYEIYSNTSTYKHIEDRHGEYGKHDQSMKDMRDVALMTYVLEDFDNAEIVMKDGKPDVTYAFSDKNGNPSKMIKFSKEINGTQHVVIATPENKYKKLWVITEYIEQKKDTSQPSNDNEVLPPTSETHSDNVSSNNIIPDDTKNTTPSFTSPTSNPDINLSLSRQEDALPIRGDIYGKDIALDLPIRDDIAPVQENAAVDELPIRKDIQSQSDGLRDDLPIREDVESHFESNAPMPETVQAEEATVTPPEKWLENKLKRIEKHLTRDIEEVNAEYNERIANAMSRQAIEGIETERLHKIDELEAEAEKERAKARESAERINRKELHQAIISDIKSGFAQKGFDFDKVLENAKNKSTFSSVDNTPQRFMEKTLGYKEGQILADLTINKTALNESRAVEWLNHFTNRKNGVLAQIVKEYGIKPRSKESAAAQMYGEGFYVNEKSEYVKYGDAELAKDFPNVDTQEKIKRLATDTRIRQIYDDTLEAINAPRRRNGYPEIPRRKNYFLHFQAMTDTFSNLGIPFNPNDIRAKDLPTDLNGVTADLKPGQPYFASANARKGIRTTYDLIGGLEKYLVSAKDQIYHIDDIQTFRALRNYVADTFGQAHGFDGLDELSEAEVEERIKNIKDSHLSTFAKFLNEQANIMAGKTALIDRGFEGMFGRRAITFMKDLNQQVGSNMVGYNLSSSLTNFVSMVQGFAKANKSAAMKALAQTTANKINGIFGRSDGFLEADPLYIRRNGAEQFTRTLWDKLKEPGYLMASAVDNISTEFLVRCKYNELVQKGMNDTNAHIEADKWASRILGDRTYGQMPQLYNSKMLGLVTKFQLEVRNQLDSMFYDTIQEKKLETENIQGELRKNSIRAAKITSTFFQLAIFQHLFGQVFESIAGYNPAFDIIEVMIKTLGFDDDEGSEDTVTDNLSQGFAVLLDDLPYTSTFTGGRVPIESALPIEQFLTGQDEYGNPKSRLETVAEALPYYVLPGGYGQLKKTVQGLSMFDDDLPIAGSYTKNSPIDKLLGRNPGKLRFSVEDNIPNRLQAAVFGQYATPQAKQYFDEERTPLTEKQTEELVDLDLPIADYWKYRDGLKPLETLEEKADYIANLDLPISKKNIMVNNLTDRKEPIDLTDYELYNSLEEMDYAIKNPGMYAVKNALGGYFATKEYYEALGKIEADKDKNGNSINGSLKKKKADYINSLDISYEEKILLFKSQYTSDDTYNMQIVEYLNNRDDISYSDKKLILKEIGFTVYEDGKVRW